MIMFLSVPAAATTDLGGGRCQQTDGITGIWDGSTADDDGCITRLEYAEMFSLENLLALGVIEGFVDHGNGVITVYYPSYGGPPVVGTIHYFKLLEEEPAVEFSSTQISERAISYGDCIPV